MIFSDDSLQHHALVLGAGGVGHALAQALAAHPRVASVTATHRGAATERDGIPYQSLDLTDDEAIAAFGTAQVSGPQAPNLIFYTAGLLHGEGLTPEKRLAEVESEALMASYRINAVAPLLLAKALSPGLPRRGPALWASLSARVGSIGDNRLGGWYSYRMSKAAHNMGLRTLAIELRRKHRDLLCVALHPGTVATKLSEPFRRPDQPKLLTPEGSAAALLKTVSTLTLEDHGSFFAYDGQPIPW